VFALEPLPDGMCAVFKVQKQWRGCGFVAQLLDETSVPRNRTDGVLILALVASLQHDRQQPLDQSIIYGCLDDLAQQRGCMPPSTEMPLLRIRAAPLPMRFSA